MPMTVYQWLCLFGVPGIIAGLIAWIVVQYKQLKLIKSGVQAILRNNLYELYDKAVARGGKTTRFERENFSNQYANYHGLGRNGVMDNLNTRYMAFPVVGEEYA